jgi:hypothetical protein
MQSLLPLQLQTIAWDLDKALKAQLYYPALLVALTLPEVCSGLALPRGRFVKEADYVGFIDAYTDKKPPTNFGLTGSECYRLRGGVVHRGSFNGHPYFGTDAVIFTIPESNAKMHAFTIQVGEKTAFLLDLGTFCAAMREAVSRWHRDHEDDAVVAANMASLITFRASGLSPFFSGVPVLASASLE